MDSGYFFKVMKLQHCIVKELNGLQSFVLLSQVLRPGQASF